MNSDLPSRLDQAISNTQSHLLSLRNAQGNWEGELSSSALSTATAVVALSLVDRQAHGDRIASGVRWLAEHQNEDGGWGDTTVSRSNLSTTLLCWSALFLFSKHRANLCPDEAANLESAPITLSGSFARCEAWIRGRVGSLEPDAIANAVMALYGKDRTFSVPILMHCAICGTMGSGREAWRRVQALPFELAALPRAWFGAIGLPVVSYALPALIAIGHARFHHAPPAVWNPQHWLRRLLWSRISPMLKALQPSTGGYLEATPLTSFVTMALACAGEKHHPCVPNAVAFLEHSQRGDGSWPIDTNLATWGTTLAVKAIWSGGETSPEAQESRRVVGATEWLLAQQYKIVHPFTNAAPGGWAWTDLPGGVPDADDTSGALIALHQLKGGDESSPEDEGRRFISASSHGIVWLLDLQNRDGGMPTFCRGWGALPFDRSTPEITAHALLAWWLWYEQMPEAIQHRIADATVLALDYLKARQRPDGAWIPLWFGNEHTPDEENPVYGTAMVVKFLATSEILATQSHEMLQAGCRYLRSAQKTDGSWGGDASARSSIEETALTLSALAAAGERGGLELAMDWLISTTREGTWFPPAPIGLYFARLWYHEKLYPVVWTLQALKAGRVMLRD